eukprot:symbB.v1.2.009986.t2/scaffold646.1/size176640/2
MQRAVASCPGAVGALQPEMFIDALHEAAPKYRRAARAPLKMKAQDNIPTITSRGTPRSSYPGSPARQSDNTPRAIPCPESLSTTLMAPPARSAESREADSPGQGRMAMILQQLPVLQAELAKAHEAQGQQAHELSSVRKELEELRQSMSMKMSPARRPSDAGITAGDIREASQASQVRHPSVPVIPAASHGNDAAASKLRARLSPPRWQGARVLRLWGHLSRTKRT